MCPATRRRIAVLALGVKGASQRMHETVTGSDGKWKTHSWDEP